MKGAKILLVGLAAFVGYKLFSKKGAAESLQFFVSKVAVRFSGITPIIDVTLGIHNPTNETLNVGSIAGELYINNNFAANIYGYQAVTIKSLGVSYFPISARLSLSGVASEIMDIINAITSGGFASLINQTLTFKGKVYAEGITFPLNFNYKVL